MDISPVEIDEALVIEDDDISDDDDDDHEDVRYLNTSSFAKMLSECLSSSFYHLSVSD